jgi:hypothetical protein
LLNERGTFVEVLQVLQVQRLCQEMALDVTTSIIWHSKNNSTFEARNGDALEQGWRREVRDENENEIELKIARTSKDLALSAVP